MTIKRILLVASLLACLSCVAGRATTGVQDLEHLNWAQAHEEGCLETVFGAENEYRRAGGEGIVVVLRHLDPDGLEQQVVITKQGEAPATARVTGLIEESMVDQLRAMHAEDPSISPEQACAKLQVESYEIDDKTLLAEEALVRLRQMSLSPVLEAPLVIHGDFFRIQIFAIATESEFRFFGHDSPDESSTPLHVWSDWLLSRVNDYGNGDEPSPRD